MKSTNRDQNTKRLVLIVLDGETYGDQLLQEVRSALQQGTEVFVLRSPEKGTSGKVNRIQDGHVVVHVASEEVRGIAAPGCSPDRPWPNVDTLLEQAVPVSWRLQEIVDLAQWVSTGSAGPMPVSRRPKIGCYTRPILWSVRQAAQFVLRLPRAVSTRICRVRNHEADATKGVSSKDIAAPLKRFDARWVKKLRRSLSHSQSALSHSVLPPLFDLEEQLSEFVADFSPSYGLCQTKTFPLYSVSQKVQTSGLSGSSEHQAFWWIVQTNRAMARVASDLKPDAVYCFGQESLLSGCLIKRETRCTLIYRKTSPTLSKDAGRSESWRTWFSLLDWKSQRLAESVETFG